MDSRHYKPLEVECARKAAGFKTRSAAARRLERTYMTVKRVEQGESASYQLLAQMAKLYNVSIQSFLIDAVADTPTSEKHLSENRTLNVDYFLT